MVVVVVVRKVFALIGSWGRKKLVRCRDQFSIKGLSKMCAWLVLRGVYLENLEAHGPSLDRCGLRSRSLLFTEFSSTRT